MGGSIAREKSYAFAVRVVRLYQYLTRKKQEYVLSKQILRSGTAIGANLEEATGGHSRADFSAKVNIAYKETRETCYWLRLLRDTDYLTAKEYASIYPDAEELCRLIGSIQKSTQKSPKTK